MGANNKADENISKETPEKEDSGYSIFRQASKGLSRKPGTSPLFQSRVTSLDRWIANQMMAVVGYPPVVLRLWDGVDVTPAVENPVAVIQYNSRKAMLKTIINPELYWGDIYCSGQLKFEGDLMRFMKIIFNNIDDGGKGSWLKRFVLWLGHRRIFNSTDKAKENIYHHYDIGNDFYKLWLDTEVMQYTCAYFPDPEMTLEQAQVAKLHHVCRKLELKPGDSVVEAGSGWGGLAMFMAKNYGVNVKAYNISKEQVASARDWAESEGLSDQVEFVLDDYRNISGQFDKFVSVGMLEHVGVGHYRALGQVIDQCLKPDGRGLIHAIGRNRPGPMNAWIERRIFPGAYPPSLAEMMRIFEPDQLSILDVENLRLHYAKTLDHWMERYEANIDSVLGLMDEEFVKAWRLYLSGSIAAFEVGDLQLFQVVFSRARNNDLPWSRDHLHSKKGKLSLVQAEAEEV